MNYQRPVLGGLALVLAISSHSAAEALPASPRKHVEVELPITEAPIAQWIVVVKRGNLRILPATSHPEQSGVVVSAPFDELSPDTLRAAVVTTKEGGTITSPLRAGQ